MTTKRANGMQGCSEPSLANKVRPCRLTNREGTGCFHFSFHFISYHLRRVALRQKPFFKGPSEKYLLSFYISKLPFISIDPSYRKERITVNHLVSESAKSRAKRAKRANVPTSQIFLRAKVP